MKPAPFEYRDPESLQSAISIMAEHGDEAKLLAGGQSLIPAMNFRLVQPTLLVDINKLSELDYVRRDPDGGLQIGAMTRHRQLEQDPLVAAVAPLIHETMPFVAHSQIRNRGTLGGSLAHADPASELPVLMVALDGRIKVQSARGVRTISASNFFQSIFTTELEPDEILIEVNLPAMQEGSGYSFIEFSRRRGDYALLGVAALLTLDATGVCRRGRLVYLNVGETPIDAQQAAYMLLNEKPTAELFEAVANAVVEKEISPTATIHASVLYLQHLARVLTQRALNTAFERAKSNAIS